MINLIKTIVYIALVVLFFVFINNAWDDEAHKILTTAQIAQ